MEKKAVCFFVALFMIFVIVALSINSGLQQDEPETIQEPGKIGDYKLEILESAVTAQPDGTRYLILAYRFTNYSDEADSMGSALNVDVFQNGIEMDSPYLQGEFGDYNLNENTYTDVLPGYSVNVHVVYKLKDLQNDPIVEISEIGYSKEKIRRAIPLSKSKRLQGIYNVGEEIPAGIYYIGVTSDYIGSSSTTLLSLSNESSDEKSIRVYVDGHYFILIEENEKLLIDSLYAVPVNQINISFDPYNLSGGMYRIGVDIPSGSYKISQELENIECKLFVYDSLSSDRNEILSEEVSGSSTITVENGQYLYISNCTASLMK